MIIILRTKFVDKAKRRYLRWVQVTYSAKGAALRIFRVLTIALFVLAIPIALITTNIRVAVSQQSVYDYSVREYDASSASGIPESELIRANGEIHDYLTSEDDGRLAITVRTSTGDLEPLFNAREISHMVDVRDLIRMMFVIQIIAVAAILTLAVMILVLWSPRALSVAALQGSLLTGGILSVGGILAISGFDSAWSQFHVVAFSNDLWQLDPDTDHLIQMFPEAFWQEITILLGAVTALEALLIAGSAAGYLALSRRRHGEEALELPKPGLVTR